MENPQQNEYGSRFDPERFETAILIAAFGLYILERCLAFAFLHSRSDSSYVLESNILGFLFGEPPYSILDVLFGFDFSEGLFAWIQPKNLLLVGIQIVDFWMNYWVLQLPLRLVSRIINHKPE